MENRPLAYSQTVSEDHLNHQRRKAGFIEKLIEFKSLLFIEFLPSRNETTVTKKPLANTSHRDSTKLNTTTYLFNLFCLRKFAQVSDVKIRWKLVSVFYYHQPSN